MSFKEYLREPLIALKTAFSKPKTRYGKLTYDDLINAESELGKTIFGPIPYGHERNFFKYKDNVWIWHESWMANNGLMNQITVRYEVRPNGVFKKQSGGVYEKISGDELENFRKAAKSYLELVKTKLYC